MQNFQEKCREWSRNPIFWILLIIILVLIFKFVRVLPFHSPLLGKFIDRGTYQAVFLTNDQVYFGKMTVRRRQVRLTDIFYLQVRQDLQGGVITPGGNIQLVKLGSELHGPQDEMIISKNNIVFWENLKDDSQVVRSIEQFKQSQ